MTFVSTTSRDDGRGAIYAAIRSRLVGLARMPSGAARSLEIVQLEELLVLTRRVERGEAL